MDKPVLNMVVCMRDDADKLMETLDSIAMQRNVDFGNIVVTIMIMELDHERTVRSEDRMFPFRVNCRSAETDNLSAAYNEAISRDDAQWIMFMECGDMLSDVYSLKIILELLPTEEYDALWTEYYTESETRDHNKWVNVNDDVDVRIHGKLFRNRFLIEEGLRFDEDVHRDEGIVFFSAVRSIMEHSRFAKISTKFVPYVHMDPLPEKTPSIEEMLMRMHEMKIACIRNVNDRAVMNRYVQAVMEEICMGYYMALVKPETEATRLIAEETSWVYAENKDAVDRMREEDVEVFLDEAKTIMLNMCNEAYVRYGHEMIFEEDDISLGEWLDKECTVPEPKKRDKVAVFCGTRNVYDSMETAAKSLMCHTKMDRVYFFIEDDVFPRELPKEFIVRNVSGQKWFNPKGPNYKNAWTYMCLMRAAFAKLMPDEDVVLSLDIDVVVNEDISELWEIGLDGYYYAGVREVEQTKKQQTTYCNFGVIMMNLKKVREDGIDDKVIVSLNKDRWGCPEQSAFNHFCAGKILELDPKYNATRAGRITPDTEEEKISHYAGIKYWKQFKPVKKYAEMSWEEVMR